VQGASCRARKVTGQAAGKLAIGAMAAIKLQAMKATLFSRLLGMALLTATLQAATPEELQFQQLQQQRAKTPAGTSQMFDQRYRTSLEQMLRNPKVASQPELARQIQAELQVAAGAGAAAAATATPPPLGVSAGRRATKTELKKLFENSQWRIRNGTPESRKAELTTMSFLKDGECGSAGGGAWTHFKFYEVETPDILRIYKHDPKRRRDAEFRAFRVNFDQKFAHNDITLGGEAFQNYVLEYDQPIDWRK
jgi:hypothetical protein